MSIPKPSISLRTKVWTCYFFTNTAVKQLRYSEWQTAATIRSRNEMYCRQCYVICVPSTGANFPSTINLAFCWNSDVIWKWAVLPTFRTNIISPSSYLRSHPIYIDSEEGCSNTSPTHPTYIPFQNSKS